MSEEDDSWAEAGMPNENQQAGIAMAAEAELKKKIKVDPTWFCVHCQEPTPKRVTVVHDGARVCPKPACIKFVILEDGYASAEVKHEQAKAAKPCGRCGQPLEAEPCLD